MEVLRQGPHAAFYGDESTEKVVSGKVLPLKKEEELHFLHGWRLHLTTLGQVRSLLC